MGMHHGRFYRGFSCERMYRGVFVRVFTCSRGVALGRLAQRLQGRHEARGLQQVVVDAAAGYSASAGVTSATAQDC